ncbi:MAG: serine/threonine protein phosphatase [Nitrospirae bacterium]|nr:serine/threonine protein phosphatase [Nitrospirota bacterium]
MVTTGDVENVFLKAYDALERGSFDSEIFLDLVRADFSNERELKDYEELLNILIARTQNAISPWPPVKTDILKTTVKITDIAEIKPFREGEICYIPVSKNESTFIIGDLHGDRESFVKIMEKTQFLTKHADGTRIIALGDYIDRGLHGLNIIVGLVLLKLFFPEQILLLKGNHEVWEKTDSGKIIPTVSGDNEFIEGWEELFSPDTFANLKNFFDDMPAMVFTNNGGLLAHGGIPRPEGDNHDYSFIKSLADLNSPKIIKEVLWSDPEDKETVIITGDTRFSFAKKHFESYMQRIGGSFMIRGHEPVSQGSRYLFDNKLLTVFSTGGSGAYEGYAEMHPAFVLMDGNGEKYIFNV